MNQTEKDAIYSIFCELTKDVQPKYILAPLIQYRVVTHEDLGGLDVQNYLSTSRSEQILVKMIETCSLETFVNILRHENIYDHLVELVFATISQSKGTENTNGVNYQNAGVPSQLSRINIYTGSRKKVKRVAHLLKRLIHFGKAEEFQKNVNKIESKWNFMKNNPRVTNVQKAEVADLLFSALDCQLANMRIKNDPGMYNHQFFKEMVAIIPYTSNPILSSMSYTARFGATVILEEPLDHGLAHLMTAKMHSEMIVPCKEAGMVYYQEIDILVRKYEIETNDVMKQDMLSRCRLALNQFDEETSAVKEDFTRMLFLRMANIYLGINVFGSVIAHVQISDGDLREAENCLKMVKSTWNGMDTRRKMFYYIAKAVLNQNRNRPDIALVKSKLALELANQGKFLNEKPSIEILIQKFEFEFAANCENEIGDTINDLDAIMADDED
ncbi:hypothetical protein LOTGIDRAFT_158307 [Lottia gigantea]|uniref:CARD domain-containing protein n=1 Tax=Lottia gigantea TaxID=225164 RepID=V4CDQ6_LOTGI|nr:hypothetical protein LOTGIDRAFT_158307 [Lottia gigantea]ESP00075.1 hypothetical protein LOTGIDRAFT_158307 [Lottia gigantea]